MFVPLPPGLEEILAHKVAAARPPPGLALPAARAEQAPASPRQSQPLPHVGDVFLALSRTGQASPVARRAAVVAPLHLHEALTADTTQSTPKEEERRRSRGSTQELPVKQLLDGTEDMAEAEAMLRPVLQEVIGKGQLRAEKGGKPGAAGAAGSCVRWWARPDLPLLCPLTRFPIGLLPYPPFKLRIDPKRSSPHRLVDGKFLAMHVIVTSNYFACGRELEASDLQALDDYVHRCKLGPYRPGRAALLAKEAATAECPERRERAAKEHERFVAAARTELGKLRRIQENRLLQISKVPAAGQAPRTPLSRSRVSSGASTASTAASSSSSVDA